MIKKINIKRTVVIVLEYTAFIIFFCVWLKNIIEPDPTRETLRNISLSAFSMILIIFMIVITKINDIYNILTKINNKLTLKP